MGDFPETWKQDCSGAGARVEIRIGGEVGQPANTLVPEHQWVEIPTAEVELWETKTSKQRLKRSARVEFPTTWGIEGPNTVTNSPRELLNGYETGDEKIQHARVQLEHPNGEWITKHIGWITAVGGTGDQNLSKMWIYDYLELLDHVPASETFNHPTVQEAASKVAQLVNDNAPVPLSNVVIIPPQTERAKATVLERAPDSLLSPDSSEYAIPGSQNGSYYSNIEVEGDINETGETYLASFISTGPEVLGTDITAPIPIKQLVSKSFRSNHDTIMDVFNWFEERTGARLHFEPHESGDSAVLIADVVPSSRIFAGQNVAQKLRTDVLDASTFTQSLQSELYEFHEVVDIWENDALFQIKPINTVYVRGDVGEGFTPDLDTLLVGSLGITVTGGLAGVLGAAYLLENSQPPSKKFPVVKAQVPTLLEAAEGHVLAPPVVESDATTLQAAKREAVDKLQKHLQETGEGKITMDGMPKITPNDVIDAFEQCGDIVILEEQPVRYDIHEVKHTKKAGEAYKTEARVGIWAGDSRIEVTRSRMEEMTE